MELFSFGEAYPGLFTKAAVYLEGIVRGHCFADGNKRTGYLVTYTFLKLNGYELLLQDNDIYETVIRIAKNEINIEQIENWIKVNSFRI